MGRNLSPALRQELANLGKDSDSRRIAMQTLKLYVNDLDSKSIPLFLAEVSEAEDAGSSSVEYTIAIYEVLARVHGPNIVPQLDNIMSKIVKTLTTSGGSFPLQQACSKVVPAVARYGIEPTTPEEKKRSIIHSLCKPLSDSLLGTQESLSCGAAFCLSALVDCENWRFASDDMVNKVCLKLAGALEDRLTQTNSHMGLVMSLAKRNSHIVEPYARLLIRTGLDILNCGLSDRNSQKQLTAIQMVHSLIKCLDIRSVFSELDFIIKEMKKCQSDQMPHVKGAAIEAMQTARRLLVNKSSKISCDDVSLTGSNFSPRSRSPLSISPESQTLDSFSNSFVDPQGSRNVNHVRKSLNRKLWYPQNGYADESIKVGGSSELACKRYRYYASSEHEGSDTRSSYANRSPRFTPRSVAHGARRSLPQSPFNRAVTSMPQSPAKGALRSRPQSPVNGTMRSQTPSSQRKRSQSNVDNGKIFTTSRKLVRSLQNNDDSDYDESDYPSNRSRRLRSPCPAKRELSSMSKYNHKRELSPMSKYNRNHGCSSKVESINGTGDMTNVDEVVCCDSTSESTSSTKDVLAATNGNPSFKMFKGDQSKTSGKRISTFLSFVFPFLSVGLATLLFISDQGETLGFVPT